MSGRDPDELLDVRQIAEYFKVSAKSVYSWIKAGRLPGAFRVGGLWRIARRDLPGPPVHQ